jgi:hypothetical protein
MPVFADQRPAAPFKVALRGTVEQDAPRQPKADSPQGVQSRDSLARNYGF